MFALMIKYAIVHQIVNILTTKIANLKMQNHNSKRKIHNSKFTSLCALVPLCLSVKNLWKSVESVATFFLQNEPNFSSILPQKRGFRSKTNPIRTQTNPKRTQF